MRYTQGITKKRRLSWLTVASSYMSPNAGGVAGYSYTVYTWSPNILWRSITPYLTNGYT